MKITFQFVNLPVSESMQVYTLEKLRKLEKKYEWVLKAQVFFKIEKGVKANDILCEIELSLPGPRIFASSSQKNYEMAVKETISELNKKLKKRKAGLKPYM